jgi:phenylpyruvate tautomerase PptA (4-oxalocrotonate tautomerase family)
MPLVRIALRRGNPPAFARSVADGVHRAMVETIDIPADDRFQIVSEHGEDGLICDPNYLGIRRSDDVVFVQITLRAGRSAAKKQALFRRIVEHLAEDPGIRPEDVLIVLTENTIEDWSFGQGEAQYLAAQAVLKPREPATA